MGFFDFLTDFVAPTVAVVALWSFVIIGCGLVFVAFRTRTHWVPQFRDAVNSTYDNLSTRLPAVHFPGQNYLYSRLPSSFAGDMEAGLSSSTFDLSENIGGSDSRAGLDDAAKNEILKIMKKRRLPFDRARKYYMEQRFAANGISADGRPRDPKFVSFS